MNHYSNQSRAEKRTKAVNEIFWALGHFSNYLIFIAIIIMPSEWIFPENALGITIAVILMVMLLFYFMPISILLSIKEAPLYETKTKSYLGGLVSILSVMKLHFYYVRWILTGKDHPVLIKYDTKES